MAEHAIAERLLYRIVKRHIAGTTMSSAIEKAKELNNKKLLVSISFLSESATDTSKARYATTTYLELIRRISRMGLKASIQVPLSQVGFDVSDDVAAKNINEILATAKSYGVFVWLEIQHHGGNIPSFLHEAKGVGYAVSIDHTDDYLRINKKHIRALKILCSDAHLEKEEDRKISNSVRSATKSVSNPVLQSPPPGVIKNLMNGSDLRKLFTFEFQLGYDSKKLSSIIKRGGRASVFVPFGKDWAHYAASRTPERYARFIATRILREE